MPGPTLSTGGISLETGRKQTSNTIPVKRSGSEPFHMLILGNFSGSHSNQNSDEAIPIDLAGIANRKLLEVDRDNFDELFATLDVQLNLPIADEPILFSELDDLHPDYLYERIPLFDKVKSLKRRLKSADTFAAAAKEINLGDAAIRSETSEPAEPFQPSKSSEAAPVSSPDDSESLLDALLGSQKGKTSATISAAGEIDVSRLVKDIFAPYVIQRPDPRQDEYLAAADQAAAHLMRKVLHSSDFQQLEATWRGLYLLVRRAVTDTDLKIYIADLSQEELAAAATAGTDLEQSPLYKLIVDKRATVGGTPFSLVMADYRFSDSALDAQMLGHCADLAEQIQAPLITNGHERMAGCDSLAKTPDTDDWDYSTDAEFQTLWNQVRNQSGARFLGVTCPRFMVRLPYGKRTSPTEKFAFEELPEQLPHEFYCWANSGWLVVLLIAQHRQELGRQFTLGRIQEVDRLPLHTYDDDGEPTIKPCAEMLMTDRTATRLLQAGLMPVRSITNKNAVLVPGFESAAEQNSAVAGPWQPA